MRIFFTICTFCAVFVTSPAFAGFHDVTGSQPDTVSAKRTMRDKELSLLASFSRYLSENMQWRVGSGMVGSPPLAARYQGTTDRTDIEIERDSNDVNRGHGLLSLCEQLLTLDADLDLNGRSQSRGMREVSSRRTNMGARISVSPNQLRLLFKVRW